MTDLETIAHQWDIAIINSAADRVKAEEMTRRLKALYTARKAALDEIVGPLKDRIAEAKAASQVDEIEAFARKVLAACDDYDRRQAAAKRAEIAARAAAAVESVVTRTPAPQIPTVEPETPMAKTVSIVIDGVNLNELPRLFCIADEAAIKRAIREGCNVPGVRWHYDSKSQWRG